MGLCRVRVGKEGSLVTSVRLKDANDPPASQHQFKLLATKNELDGWVKGSW